MPLAQEATHTYSSTAQFPWSTRHFLHSPHIDILCYGSPICDTNPSNIHSSILLECTFLDIGTAQESCDISKAWPHSRDSPTNYLPVLNPIHPTTRKDRVKDSHVWSHQDVSSCRMSTTRTHTHTSYSYCTHYSDIITKYPMSGFKKLVL